MASFRGCDGLLHAGEQVPGVPETTQVNQVELDAEARSSDLETDTSQEEYSENEEKFSDYYSDGETETTDHSGIDMSETDSELESEDNDTAFTYQQDMKSNMATKFMSKSQRRHVRRNLYEIGDAYTAEAKQAKEVYVTKLPRQINDRPKPRKPGPWRVVEIFTWTAIVTILAGMMLPQWEAWEPITLPRCNLMDSKVRTEAIR